MKRKLTFMLIAFAVAGIYSYTSANEPVTGSNLYTVEQIIEKAPTLVGQTVQIQGRVAHVCKTSGRKLFLETTDEKKTFRINAGKNIKKFNPDLIDSVVIVTGVVAETRLTLENLKKQELQAIEAEKVKKAAEHCSSEAKAEGQDIHATPLQRIQVQIAKINKQVSEGKNNYLSFYAVNGCNTYVTVKE
ncbi:MAG: hypothetical protein H6Q18_715 [Bacteroidetes bacterium]|nr:hypothetical protein [Bacteroidota bacterium]